MPLFTIAILHSPICDIHELLWACNTISWICLTHWYLHVEAVFLYILMGIKLPLYLCLAFIYICLFWCLFIFRFSINTGLTLWTLKTFDLTTLNPCVAPTVSSLPLCMSRTVLHLVILGSCLLWLLHTFSMLFTLSIPCHMPGIYVFHVFPQYLQFMWVSIWLNFLSGLLFFCGFYEYLCALWALNLLSQVNTSSLVISLVSLSLVSSLIVSVIIYTLNKLFF